MPRLSSRPRQRRRLHPKWNSLQRRQRIVARVHNPSPVNRSFNVLWSVLTARPLTTVPIPPQPIRPRLRQRTPNHLEKDGGSVSLAVRTVLLDAGLPLPGRALPSQVLVRCFINSLCPARRPSAVGREHVRVDMDDHTWPAKYCRSNISQPMTVSARDDAGQVPIFGRRRPELHMMDCQASALGRLAPDLLDALIPPTA